MFSRGLTHVWKKKVKAISEPVGCPIENSKSLTHEQDDFIVRSPTKQLNYTSESEGSSHEDCLQDNTFNNIKSAKKIDDGTEAVGTFSAKNSDSFLLTITQMINIYEKLDTSKSYFQELKNLLGKQN